MDITTEHKICERIAIGTVAMRFNALEMSEKTDKEVAVGDWWLHMNFQKIEIQLGQGRSKEYQLEHDTVTLLCSNTGGPYRIDPNRNY